MPSTARVDRFIRRWHRGPWSVGALPVELGAYNVDVDLPGRILGICRIDHDGQPVIGIRSSIADTRYYLPVLAHECGHVLMNREGVFECQPLPKHERQIWRLAARLAVPEWECESIRSAAMCSDSVARQLRLPPSFVRFAAHGDQLLPVWLQELERAPR